MTPNLEKPMMPMKAMLMSNKTIATEGKVEKTRMQGLKSRYGSIGMERKFLPSICIKPTGTETEPN